MTPDPDNANRGTERGLGLIEKSIEQFGAARSAVADADGVIRAGNKSFQAAVEKGFPVEVIESDGRTFYVIKRNDLSGARAKLYALADNQTSSVDYDLDPDVVRSLIGEGVQAAEFFLDRELSDLLGEASPIAPAQAALAVCPNCGYELR